MWFCEDIRITSIKFAAKLQQKGKPRHKKSTASRQQLSALLCVKFFNLIKKVDRGSPKDHSCEVSIQCNQITGFKEYAFI